MDIDFIVLVDGVWSYRDPKQQEVSEHCLNLLNWNLYEFDLWLFNRNQWSMYTRRRQILMSLRTDLAAAYELAPHDALYKDNLLINFSIDVWSNTRVSKFKEIDVIQSVDFVYDTVKKKLRGKDNDNKPKVNGQTKGNFAT